jgi:predicted AlkP superfamily pyrophosphatase or phosphodiesterase
MKLAAAFVLALAACGAPAYSAEPVTSSSTTASRPRLVLVSIDGMMPDVIPSAPTLRGLAHRGASARIEPVFLTVTYPSHTC